MKFKILLLRVHWTVIVKVIQPCLADPNHVRIITICQQLVCAGDTAFTSGMWMNADRHTNAIVGCRDRLDSVEILKLGRDAYHMANTSIFSTANKIRRITLNFFVIQMAVAVDQHLTLFLWRHVAWENPFGLRDGCPTDQGHVPRRCRPRRGIHGQTVEQFFAARWHK